MSDSSRGGERGGRPTSPPITTITTSAAFTKEPRNPLSILQDNISINSTTRVSSFTFDTLPSSISVSTNARNLSNNNTIDGTEYSPLDNPDFQSSHNTHFNPQQNNPHPQITNAPTTSNNSTTGENEVALSSSASEISNMDMSVVSATSVSDAFYTVVDANINQSKPRTANVESVQNVGKRTDTSSYQPQKPIRGTGDLVPGQVQSIAISAWEGDSVDTAVKDHLMSAQIRRQKVSELKEGEFIPFSPLTKSATSGSRLESSSGHVSTAMSTLFTPGSVPPIAYSTHGSSATSSTGVGAVPSIFSTIMDVEEESSDDSTSAYTLSKAALVESTPSSTEKQNRKDISDSGEISAREFVEAEAEHISGGIKSNAHSSTTPSPVVSNFVIGRRSTLGILGNENYIGRLPNIDQGSESDDERDKMSIDNNTSVGTTTAVAVMNRPDSAITVHEKENTFSSTGGARRGAPFIHRSLLDDSADDMSIDSITHATSHGVDHQIHPTLQTQSIANIMNSTSSMTTRSTRTNIELNLSAFDYDESYRENDNNDDNDDDSSKTRHLQNEHVHEEHEEHESADISMDITRGNVNDQIILKPVEITQQAQPLWAGFAASAGFTSPTAQRRRGIDRMDKAERSVTKRSSILVSPRERRTSLRTETHNNDGSESESEEDKKGDGKDMAERANTHMPMSVMHDITSHDISAMDMSITKALPESIIALINPPLGQVIEETAKSTKESKDLRDSTLPSRTYWK